MLTSPSSDLSSFATPSPRIDSTAPAPTTSSSASNSANSSPTLMTPSTTTPSHSNSARDVVLNFFKKRERVKCAIHGDQEFTLACIHICKAIDSKKQVGFVFDPDSDGPRPDAWCSTCEKWMVDHPDASIDDVVKVADFQR